MSFRVLVCGSRGWRDGQRIYDRLVALDREHEQVTVIEGRAKDGADRLARGWAWKLGMGLISVPVKREEYRLFGRGGPNKRNERMLALDPHLVIAFWDGKSNGTRHMIGIAKAKGTPVEIHYPEEVR